jgi:hypothetical protein
MEDNAVEIPETVQGLLRQWKSEGKSVALAAMGVVTEGKMLWELVASFAISDPIRQEAPAVIKALRERGTEVWMLSGDNKTTGMSRSVLKLSSYYTFKYLKCASIANFSSNRNRRPALHSINQHNRRRPPRSKSRFNPLSPTNPQILHLLCQGVIQLQTCHNRNGRRWDQRLPRLNSSRYRYRNRFRLRHRHFLRNVRARWQ